MLKTKKKENEEKADVAQRRWENQIIVENIKKKKRSQVNFFKFDKEFPIF